MSSLHRVSFWAISTSVTAAEITEILGLEPDGVSVRGSRDPNFPRPRNHTWRIREDSPERTIEAQARAVVERLRPHRDGLLRLAAHPEVDIHMSIHRELDSDMEPVAVGWHLDLATLAFLVSINAEIDCDEYLMFEPTFVEALRAWTGRRHWDWNTFRHRLRRRLRPPRPGQCSAQ